MRLNIPVEGPGASPPLAHPGGSPTSLSRHAVYLLSCAAGPRPLWLRNVSFSFRYLSSVAPKTGRSQAASLRDEHHAAPTIFCARSCDDILCSFVSLCPPTSPVATFGLACAYRCSAARCLQPLLARAAPVVAWSKLRDRRLIRARAGPSGPWSHPTWCRRWSQPPRAPRLPGRAPRAPHWSHSSSSSAVDAARRCRLRCRARRRGSGLSTRPCVR